MLKEEKKEDEFIYLDHQASTPLGDGVLEAMLPYFEANYANPHSSHHLMGLEAGQSIEGARKQVAELIDADDDEIFFTSGATEANNIAILTGNESPDENTGVLVSSIEHKCVLEAARHRNKDKRPHIPVDHNGEVNIIEFETMLSKYKPSLVSVMLANNEIGTIQDIQNLTDIAHNHGALFHCDGAQAVTHQSISVHDLDVDFFSLSAHKLNGPKGIGALYVSRYVKENIHPILFGGDQEKGLRSGTLPTALCVGFGKAAENWFGNGERYRECILKLRNEFWDHLRKEIPTANLIGPNIEKRHAANLSIHFTGLDAEVLLTRIQDKIAASTGSACTSGFQEPSHVISSINSVGALEDGVIRFSFGLNNSTSQIKEAIQILSQKIGC